MVDKKITELTELVTPVSADVLAIVDDPAGTPVTKKITFANVESNIDHTAIANIGTNTHSQIDTHIADTTDAHTVSSDTLTLTNKTIDDFTNEVDADRVHIEVRNESGGTINKGDAVYQSGYNVGEDLMLVSLADATDSSTMPALGIVQSSSIANNANGAIIELGRLSSFNTTAFVNKDPLYISETGTTGNTLTATKPTGTALIQKIAHVLKSSASGTIEIFGAGRSNDIPNLANTKLWIGDASGVPQQFVLSGDATMDAGGVVTIDHVNINNIGTNTHAEIDTHLANTTNPHSVDAGDVSLGNVTNVATDDTAYNATSWNTNTDSATKNAIRDKVETMDTAISSNTSASHAESHNIVSHSDTTATGAELNTLTGGGDTTLHDHDGISENTTHRGLTNNPHSTEMIDDATPELGGEMDAGAHSIGFTQQSATGDGTTTIDWRLGNKFFFTFGNQNDTFTFTAPSNPCNILLVLKQYSTGGKTATWPGSVKWPGGTAPTLSTGNNEIDIISFYYDGTNYYGVESLNFS